MSSANRTKVLLGFGALVVILVAAIVLWPANFRKEDASGAIGEVQKHRAPQITQKDVVLGNESVKHHQKVLYADFIADATKLKAIGERADAAQLSEFALELQNRWLTEATEALAAAEAAARHSGVRAYEDEVAALQNGLRARKEMSDTDRQEFNLKLAHLAEEMSSRTMSHIVADADQQLAAVSNELASAKMENEYLAVSKQLEHVAAALSSEELFATSLADEVEYLQAVQLETRVLNTRLAAEEMAHRLSEQSEALMSRAIKNIEEEQQLNSEMAMRFRDMDDQVSRATRVMGSRAGALMGAEQELNLRLAGVRKELDQRSTEFREREAAMASEELMAVKAMDARLEGRTALLHRLEARQTP
jgi:hypothetical protein